MCKDNTITASWSWISAFFVGLFVLGGIIATSLGADLTWGEIIIFPFLLTFWLNKKSSYRFEDSVFTVRRMVCNHTISAEEINQIEVMGTKSGTWIVVELIGAPTIACKASRMEIIIYCLRNYRKSFLIPLQWGERDNALEILRKYF